MNYQETAAELNKATDEAHLSNDATVFLARTLQAYGVHNINEAKKVLRARNYSKETTIAVMKNAANLAQQMKEV